MYQKLTNIEGEYNSCRALWRAVVLQALIDIKSRSNKKMAKIYRIKSLIWVNLNNDDFIEVCALADLSPVYVYQKKLELMKKNPLLKYKGVNCSNSASIDC